jgi:hypothetical protein
MEPDADGKYRLVEHYGNGQAGAVERAQVVIK